MKTLRRRPNAEIDWPQIHARLAQAAASMREAMQPSAERAAILLKERARRLAKPLTAPRSSAAVLDLLTFTLTGELYGIETGHVQEVVRLAGVTPVPGVPKFVAGLFNLRGQVLVAFDIRPLFDLATKDVTDASRIVVCGNAWPDLGLLADAVHDVVRLPADDVLPNSLSEQSSAAHFVRGITRDAMIVVDGATLLADQRLFVDQNSRQ